MRFWEFSPPAWGWSLPAPFDPQAGRVLPTRVGMVRSSAGTIRGGPGSPHPRGDGPGLFYAWGMDDWFSPPAWGWSWGPGRRWDDTSVLPTRVGMVLTQPAPSSGEACSPHPRGDGPDSLVTFDYMW